MLDYGWGNPSSIMLPGEENGQDSENRQIFDPYSSHGFSETANVITPEAHFAAAATVAPHHQSYYQTQNTLSLHQPNLHFPTFYDSRAYASSAPSYPPPAGLLSQEPAVQNSFMVVPKAEPLSGGVGMEFNYGEYNSRIGLNLGGRTYFASSDDDFVSRLYRRSRILETGGAVNAARCQAEGCNADLSHAKHYHRRHKVCEFHSKAATVIAAGLTQRFCQQCSRFHELPEFDNGKRSCRKRLADHNRRRRKSQNSNQETSNRSHTENTSAPNSSSENPSRSPPDSGLHSSSVTVAISPPRIALDCFAANRSYTTSSTASACSLFYSND